MKRPVTYSLIGIAVIIGVLIGTLLIAPRFFDVNRYKGTIEKLVSQQTGMTVRLGGDISLALFPWVVLSFNDLQMERAAAQGSGPLVNVASFQARLKTVPLLTKNIEISTFAISGLDIVLRKAEDGTWNWQEPAAPQPAPSPQEQGQPGPETPSPAPAEQAAASGGFALKSLQVDEFSLTDGHVVIEDQVTGQKRELSEINLLLRDISLDQPIPLDLQARLDGQPITLAGTFGPLGAEPLAGDLPISLEIAAFDALKARINGRLTELRQNPGYTADITVEPFNLKELLPRLSPSLTVSTSDPKALQHVAMQTSIQGTKDQAIAKETTIQLDDTAINLTNGTVAFAGPRLELDISVDNLNLDRYLPPPTPQPKATAKKADRTGEPTGTAATPAPAGNGNDSTGDTTSPSPAPEQRAAASTAAASSTQPDYQALRSLSVNASILVGKLVAHGALLENIVIDLSGAQGLFLLKPLEANLYQGTMSADGLWDVRQEVPAAALKATLSGVQVGPLLRDAAQKDILEGSLSATLDLKASGDRSENLKQSLNGSANLLFTDGALIGLDLAQLARTISSGFSLDEQGERPRTDFAELRVPLTAADGLVTIPEATLKSPFIRAQASGTANLVDEALNLRLTPRLVATIKGQGDEEERAGLSVPVLVRGTFTDPEFLPDLEGLVKEQLTDEETVREIIKTGRITPEQKEQLSEDVEKAKGLLKGLFGR